MKLFSSKSVQYLDHQQNQGLSKCRIWLIPQRSKNVHVNFVSILNCIKNTLFWSIFSLWLMAPGSYNPKWFWTQSEMPLIVVWGFHLFLCVFDSSIFCFKSNQNENVLKSIWLLYSFFFMLFLLIGCVNFLWTLMSVCWLVGWSVVWDAVLSVIMSDVINS